ncbi:BnaA06g25750D [Brassica napus]|uniref:BnaA06g25750D protein n=1 Tax=Brassica napus TaxID=3708 RepID=A0A078GVL5_BRANA|nr:BnaA06g25750D [Brassica napus]
MSRLLPLEKNVVSKHFKRNLRGRQPL